MPSSLKKEKEKEKEKEKNKEETLSLCFYPACALALARIVNPAKAGMLSTVVHKTKANMHSLDELDTRAPTQEKLIDLALFVRTQFNKTGLCALKPTDERVVAFLKAEPSTFNGKDVRLALAMYYFWKQNTRSLSLDEVVTHFMAAEDLGKSDFDPDYNLRAALHLMANRKRSVRKIMTNSLKGNRILPKPVKEKNCQKPRIVEPVSRQTQNFPPTL